MARKADIYATDDRVTKSAEKAEKADKPATKKSKKKSTLKVEVLSLIAVAMGIFVALSMYTDAVGPLGRGTKDILKTLFGNPAYILPILIAALAVFVIISRKAGKRSAKKVILATAMLVLISGMFHLSDYYEILGKSLADMGQRGLGGGILGGTLAVLSFRLVGMVGSWLLLITLFLTFFIFTFEVSIVDLFQRFMEIFREFDEDDDGQDFDDPVLAAAEKERIRIQKQLKREEKKKLRRLARKQAVNEDASTEADDDEETPKSEITEVSAVSEETTARSVNDDDEIDVPPFFPSIKRRDKKEEPANNASRTSSVADDNQKDSEEINIPTYKIPSIALLKNTKPKNTGKEKDKIEKTAKKLVSTLASFGVDARVIAYSVGPSVTRYELQPSAGVKISKIVGLSDDIAMNLAAIGVRIEAPIPGKAAIGIEIPHADGSIVGIRDVLSDDTFDSHPSKISFALGKDISGKTVVVDISNMPHLLIAGSTGSGKSVCINTIITSLLYKATPDEVRLILIDPKMVELGGYSGIPHLLIPVVTDPNKASGALNWAVGEMTKRYKMFANNNVRDIKTYNALALERDWEPMPQIVIIIDELSDLMMIAPNDVEESICRLAQMARAAGMHLVIATQRPSVDVITGIIKANIPSRISFAVSSQVDSRTILDMSGAEKLIGRGDMLFMPVGSNKPIRVQGAFVTDKEVKSVVDHVKKQVEVEYDQDVIEHVEHFEPTDSKNNNKDRSIDGADELLPQAIEMALESGQASVAMYQRRLKIGYQRAARIIDQLEERGIIGHFDGTKPRQLLISRADYNEMLMNQSVSTVADSPAKDLNTEDETILKGEEISKDVETETEE